jgi:AraC family transcriptional regulator
VLATAGEQALRRSSAGRIEADVTTAFGRVQVCRQSWSEPIDLVGVSDQHWLQLCLLPSTHTERGRFPERWRPHHFEPIGELFLLPAGEPVHARSECRHQLAVACAFEPAATEAWLGADLAWTGERLKGSLDLASPVIRGQLARLGDEVRNPGFGSAALIELMAGQIAIELGRHFRAIGAEPAAGGLAPWRLRLIDERLAAAGDAPTLGELAQLVGLSVRQLARGFRATRGESIGAHVAANRIEQAKRLLASDASIKAVAHALGFASPSNFTAAFRRATGQTPRAYRQRTAARPLLVPRRPRRR